MKWADKKCKHCGVSKAREDESAEGYVCAAPNRFHDWVSPDDPVLQKEGERAEDYGKRLVAEGYQQTSYRHRHVGRVPPGKTAIEVLEEVSPEAARRIRQQHEQWARMELLRVFSVGQLVLTEEQFDAFRKAGGQAV